MKYEVVMGLEVHVELATQTKLFCSCSAHFGADANQNTCPACVGMPGMPAVLNKGAVELAIAAALVTNSKITPVMTFDKKNYFYPDLPTGYQITQLFAPICRDGWVDIEVASETRRITLKQIHIEEDAGKMVHDGRIGASLVDYNRASVPLVEIVSNPDFRTAEEVIAYLEKLRLLLSFAGVSDCKMQEGSMRCDVNISVRPFGQAEYGTRTEIKNMNSLKAITAAIAHESQRHIDLIEGGRGDELVQETRRWDDDIAATFSMREKEAEADYRYFPNPEILPVTIHEGWISHVRAILPEPSHKKFARLTGELGLSDYDAGIITGSKTLSDIFDGTMRHFPKAKEVVNWIIVELLAIAKGDNKGEDDVSIDCEKFAAVMELVDSKKVNRATGKKLLSLVWKDNIDPVAYVEENNLGMVQDDGLVQSLVAQVLVEFAASVQEYREGNAKAYNFLVGQTMRKLAGKADPAAVNAELKRQLEGQ